MSRRARAWLTALGLGIPLVAVYGGPVADTVARQHATCAFDRSEGSITYNVHLWFSSQCTWAPRDRQLLLPSIFLLGLLVVLFVANFVADYHHGPPEWSCWLAAFGLGGACAAALGGASFGVFWVTIGTKPMPTGDAKIGYAIFGFLTVFIIPVIGGLWIWGRATPLIAEMLMGMGGGRGAGGAAFAGSVLGGTIGVAVGVGVVFALLVALMIYALIAIFAFMVGATVVGGFVSAARR